MNTTFPSLLSASGTTITMSPKNQSIRAFWRYHHKNDNLAECNYQLDNRYPEFLQVGNLFHQTGISPGAGWIYAGVRVLREALHVQFVEDRIRFGTRLRVSLPVKCRAVTR